MFKLIREFIDATKQLKEARAELATIDDLRAQVRERDGQILTLSSRTNQLQSENSTLKQNIRKQNEADLLMVSLQIANGVLRGEKKEDLQDLITRQTTLQNQLGAVGGGNPYGLGLSGIGLGALGGIWPRH